LTLFVLASNEPTPLSELCQPALSVVVPTFNERLNVVPLIDRLRACLGTDGWEAIFVDDDSPDGTAGLLRELAQDDPRIRCISRFGRRGLSSACIEGMFASQARYVAVIDADLQHDERLLVQMRQTLDLGTVDIVVGSRYVPGGGVGHWRIHRVLISRLATRLSARLLSIPLSDPMSGFFMMRREVLTGSLDRLSGIGFKILLDLFSSHERPLRFVELPYQFRTRHAGDSKLDSGVAWDYLLLLIAKSLDRLVLGRFMAFSLVGAIGLAVHLFVLGCLYQWLGAPFIAAQAAAIALAIVSNFTLNNLVTYRDVRVRGAAQWWRALFKFAGVCMVGAVLNMAMAQWMFQQLGSWWQGALAGIVVGSVWNFMITKSTIWAR
jgi:dolichol-phosphate mannosyltransferase